MSRQLRNQKLHKMQTVKIEDVDMSPLKFMGSANSSEENDVVIDNLNEQESSTQSLEFRQLDFLWLFNPYLNFSQRQNFKLSESELTLQDYQEMRRLNRALLTGFLKECQDTSVAEAVQVF